MVDRLIVRDEGGDSTFTPHPEGQFAAACVDVIDMGWRVNEWQGEEKLVYKLALVFVTDTDADTNTVSMEFTASMGEKANLRHFLESWRGRSYKPEQIAQGIPVDKLAGQGALLSVEHKVSRKGRTYARIRSIAPLPQTMQPPVANGYTRPDFWAERKAEYANEAAIFRARTQPAPLDDEPIPTPGDDDDLPF